MSEQKEKTAEVAAELENTAPEAAAQDTYQVGYKHPPKHTQFQKGVPSVRKGKKRNNFDYDEIFWRIAREQVSVTIGDKIKKMTRVEACLRKLMQLASSGDLKAMDVILNGYASRSAEKLSVERRLARLAEHEHFKQLMRLKPQD